MCKRVIGMLKCLGECVHLMDPTTLKALVYGSVDSSPEGSEKQHFLHASVSP